MKNFWKLTLLIFGGIFLILGLVGIFFPILPTTPFLLLSASCFLRSSHTAYRRLMTHKVLGKYIFHYRVTKAVPLKSKVAALSFLWIGILVSVYFAPILWVKGLLLLIAVCVTMHITSLKTLMEEDSESFEEEYRLFLENDCQLPNNKN
jgi:uncharacterized protein